MQVRAQTAHFKIELVFSNNPNAYGLLRASQNNIPTLTFRSYDFNDRQEFDATLSKNWNKVILI